MFAVPVVHEPMYLEVELDHRMSAERGSVYNCIYKHNHCRPHKHMSRDGM